MAYSDIQNKVGQIQLANRVLLAQTMGPNKTPETDLEGFQEQGGYAPEEIGKGVRDYDLREVNKDTPVEGTLDRRKRISGSTYKGRNNKKLPSDADIQTEGNMRGQPSPEDIFGPDYEGGPTYTRYLNNLLQIGGAAGSMIPFMGGNILKMLIGGPNAMASTPQDGRTPTRLFYNNPYPDRRPDVFIKDEQMKEDAKERFKGLTGIDLAMNFEDAGFGEGGFISTDKPHIYINRGAEAYILMPDGDFRFDGFYDPARHGNAFPGLGLVQRNDGMKIAKLPHTPPIEKMVVGNKLENSPLRFRTNDQREQYMLDYSKNFRYDGT